MNPQHEMTIHELMVIIQHIPDIIGQMPAYILLWVLIGLFLIITIAHGNWRST